LPNPKEGFTGSGSFFIISFFSSTTSIGFSSTFSSFTNLLLIPVLKLGFSIFSAGFSSTFSICFSSFGSIFVSYS